MLPSGSSRPNREHPNWCLFVMVWAIFALTASLATRTSVPTDLHGLPPSPRQHRLPGNISMAMPSSGWRQLQSHTFTGSKFLSAFLACGPSLSHLLFDESLYNRPPPSC